MWRALRVSAGRRDGERERGDEVWVASAALESAAWLLVRARVSLSIYVCLYLCVYVCARVRVCVCARVRASAFAGARVCVSVLVRA